MNAKKKILSLFTHKNGEFEMSYNKKQKNINIDNNYMIAFVHNVRIQRFMPQFSQIQT